MKTFLALAAVASLALAACGPLPAAPTPNSDPAAATAALEGMGYTNVTNVRPLNQFDHETCTQEEAVYCNSFTATDRRGFQVWGVVVEETDGELEVEHND